jgi:hypothetical protein
VLSVVVLLEASIGVGAYLYFRDDKPSKYPDEWDSRVAELAAYAADARDLTYKHPVYVDFLTEDEYSEQTRTQESELTPEDRKDLENTTELLRALGLASGDLDLFQATNDLNDTGTLAYYDPETERVTVRGTEMTVDLKVTLVHELTHVLQDQYFDLEQLPGYENLDEDDELPDEAQDAFEADRALVEGDAMRIEYEYVDDLSSDEADEYYNANAEDVSGAEEDLGDVPAALQAFQAAPYILGQPLVEIIADDGNDAVDDAFRDPPSTTEHMWDPRTYLDGDEPTDLDRPNPPDGVRKKDEIDHGVMGAVDLFVILGDRIDPFQALDATDGWGNARYVSYETDGRTCVRMALDGDSDTDDQELRSALDAWVAAAPAESNAAVTDLGDGHSQLESCDPGVDVDAANDRALDLMTLPATRIQIASDGVYNGASLDDAWAVGDCFVRKFTIDELTAEVTDELQAKADDAFESCGAGG